MKRIDCALLLCSLGLLAVGLIGCGDTTVRDHYDSQAATDAAADTMAPAAEMPVPQPEFNTETYDQIVENEFIVVRDEPLSTFSIDVDTASYPNVRRFLNEGQLPPPGAVRIEELINYFSYDYAPPEDDRPFAVHVDVSSCPWEPEHRLARIGLKGKVIENEERPRLNLVFLLDVSGSMGAPNKLPLLKQGMAMLTQQLDRRDRVAIVVYAGSSGLVLPSTPCSLRREILDALDRLESGGSTAGAAGIEQAYAVAEQNFDEDGVNRVILCTDGDFNVGISDQSQLIRLIEDKAESGVFLTVLGFGMGNYKDSTLEKLADKGNGNYGYIDTLHEARKVLVEELTGTLITIAKDVKIQVDFNPESVQAYRLIGYENRLLANRDFHDDTKDAGEIGAGHSVTALYELVPPGVAIDLPVVDASRYESTDSSGESGAPASDVAEELFFVKLRYKAPDGDTSRLIEFPITGQHVADRPEEDFQFAAAVAAFGMLLRGSDYSGDANWQTARELAQAGRGEDPSGYRAEFVKLVNMAETLSNGRE